MANPPFNISDWGEKAYRIAIFGNRVHYQQEMPTMPGCSYSSINLAQTGTEGIVLANGSMITNAGTENEIRKV